MEGERGGGEEGEGWANNALAEQDPDTSIYKRILEPRVSVQVPIVMFA